jgi:hypothetical protein
MPRQALKIHTQKQSSNVRHKFPFCSSFAFKFFVNVHMIEATAQPAEVVGFKNTCVRERSALGLLKDSPLLSP